MLFDESTSNKYRSFLRTFFSELNRHPKAKWLDWIQRPADMISTSVDGAYSGEEPIRSISVFHVTTLFDGKQFREIRARRIMRIDIP